MENSYDKIEEYKLYTSWINFLSFWYFIWFILYILKIIKQPPSIWFYIISIIYLLIKLHHLINTKKITKINNYKIYFIQILSTFILDILPLFKYNKLIFYINNPFNIFINILFVTSYILFIYIKFKLIYKINISLTDIIYLIYFEYNNLFDLPDINIKEYFYLKYGY